MNTLELIPTLRYPSSAVKSSGPAHLRRFIKLTDENRSEDVVEASLRPLLVQEPQRNRESETGEQHVWDELQEPVSWVRQIV